MPGDKEYYLANQLKKKCKKTKFQGIHDRFLRDHELRIRMIDYNKKLEKNHTCLLTLTSTNNGSWHRVHLLHGGIGKIPGGLLTIQKVKEEVSQVLSERGDPLLIVLWRKPPKMAFKNSIYFVTDGSFTADSGPL